MARISAMVRTAVMVADLERSNDFYTGVLGLSEVYGQGSLSHPAGAKLLGIPAESVIRYKILKVPGPDRGMVGLFEIRNPMPQAVAPPGNGIKVGETCLVFYCDDLAEVHRKLVAGGHPLICPPTHLQVTAAKGQPEMTFRDPDGIVVNLISTGSK